MALDANDPRITAYLFGELAEDEHKAFEAELTASAELRRVVAQTRMTLEQLAAELQNEPRPKLTARQRETLAQEITRRHSAERKSDTQPAEPRAVWGRRWTAVGAVAASLLCIAALAFPWLRAMTRPTEQTALTGDVPPQQAGVAVEAARSADGVRSTSAPAAFDPAAAASTADASSETSSSAGNAVLAGRQKANAVTGSGNLGGPGGMTMEISGGSPLSSGMTAQPSGTGAPQPGMPGMGSGGMYGSGMMGGMMGMSGSSYGGQLDSGGGMGMGMGMGTASGPGMGYPGMGGMPGGLPANGARNGTAEMGAYGGDGWPGMMPGMMPDMMPPMAYRSPRGDEGTGPGWSGDRFSVISENPFLEVKNEPLSTFSIDVDTASYAKVRMSLLERGMLPRPDAVRIEELINYFTYDYEPPSGDVPFAAHVEVADCPWASQHRLVRIGIKGLEMDRRERPASNLVFLLDVSGSMDQPNKLPLLQRGMKLLVNELGENDRVAIVVYAGAAGLVLDSTTGDRKSILSEALDRLRAGGSTNGGDGIQLAYQTALDHFVSGGVNRVILCTDGDFNVGVTGTDELVRLAEKNAKTGVFLSVLGFGMGNHNDAMLEQISNKGNGNYAFIDTESEARKVLVEQMTGTLVTIAKDVKIQVEFNPREAAAYRLIGYEDRLLAAEDFNDDRKDAGEIGAGHTVTALYEVIPAGVRGQEMPPELDELRYQKPNKATQEAQSGELLTLKIRYKQPDGDTSSKLTFPVTDRGTKFGQAGKDFRFAAAVASFGMLLRNSRYKGNATYAGVEEIATEAASEDTTGYRREFLQLVAAARKLNGS